MGKTLIIGASGRIGKITISQLTKLKHPVVAMLRDVKKNVFTEDVELIEGDLEADIGFAMEGCDRVVFTAGSGAGTGLDKTLLVDLWGACKAIDAAKEKGIEHFIMASSRGAGNPDCGPEAIKPYLVAKHFADEYLINSGLAYTILRPGRLIDEKGSGLITTIRPGDPGAQIISREDAASVITHCINNETVFGKIYELYKGADAIEKAVA